MRIKQEQNPTLALARACAFVAILAVVLVGIVVIAGEFAVSDRDQAAVVVKQTTGTVTGARHAAPSPNDLFSGMPLP